MTGQELSNERRMALNSVCDGFKLLWRDMEQDEVQRRVALLQQRVLDYTETDAAELSRHFKVKVLRGAAEAKGSLVAVQVTGPAARVFGHLPWSWAWALSQVHFKTYCDEVYAGATTGFADAMYHSEGTGQLSFFSPRKESNRPKDGGSKGTRVGSRKSDVHTIVYKRKRERAGIETRVQDRALNKAVNDIEQLTGSFGDDYTDARKMGGLHQRAALHGFTKFMAEARRRGVRFTDYFHACYDHPTEARQATAYNQLDYREDNDIITQ